MTPEEIDHIEAGLRTENPFTFAELFLTSARYGQVRAAVASRVGYTDIPHVNQANGGILAEALLSAVGGLIEEKLIGVRMVVVEGVCPLYCDLKRTGKIDSEALKIAIAVADALVSAKVAFPAPVTRTAGYIARNGILDKSCECSDSGES